MATPASPTDDAIIAKLKDACSTVSTQDMLRRLYWDGSALTEPWFTDIADSLARFDHVGCVHLLGEHKPGPLPSIVALLALLTRARFSAEWAHYSIAQELGAMLRAGCQEARLPLAMHAALAAECFPDNEYVQSVPHGLLGTSLMGWAPREAIRHALISLRMGNANALYEVVDALHSLQVMPSGNRFDGAGALEINEAIRADVEFATMGILSRDSAAVTTVPIDLPATIVHPAPEGDAHYYVYKQAGVAMPVDQVLVHRLVDAAFSCDVSKPGRTELYTAAGGVFLSDLCVGPKTFLADEAHTINVETPLMVVNDTFSGVVNIAHFLFDQVPRLLSYRRLDPSLSTLLQCDDSPYYRGALEALGVETVLFPAERRFTVRAPSMFLSSNMMHLVDHPLNTGSPATARMVRDAFGVSQARGERRRLYVSRADARSRRAVNAAEVEEVFRRFGFEIVTLANRSFAEQRALFAQASHVAGVHGAGLSNVVFAPEECRVLEIVPPLVASRTYWLLCSAIGQPYRAFIAGDTEMPTPDYTNWPHDAFYNDRDVIIDTDRLRRSLSDFV